MVLEEKTIYREVVNTLAKLQNIGTLSQTTSNKELQKCWRRAPILRKSDPKGSFAFTSVATANIDLNKGGATRGKNEIVEDQSKSSQSTPS
ncbi:hypothetical protein RCL_jg5764.t1 [Rhizophagus clarus]|uniref:Uncharacterized protein n=1 Tax=Rhizophagus clarus TaxID=94130 RepID=A0A8H3M706_9GLOM|nr:hypothetical protein RCL_jg5764.t1 [Rhizophagus clarus]